jgi:hypothetical protein
MPFGLVCGILHSIWSFIIMVVVISQLSTELQSMSIRKEQLSPFCESHVINKYEESFGFIDSVISASILT